jgi:ABC-type multidrug transport system fused ATPase/permease subunit
LLVIALQVALGVLLARQLGAIIDVGILADREAFGQTFLLLVLVWVGGDIALLLRQLLTGELAESVMHGLRAQVAMHLGRARIPALEQTHSGEYVSRLSNDAQVVRSAFARHLPSLVQGSLGFVASLVVMLLVSWKVTLLTLAMAPLMMFVASWLGGRMGAVLKLWQSDIAKVNVLAQDTVAGIVIAKVYNMRDYLVARMSALQESAVGNAAKLALLRGQMHAAMTVFSVVPFLVLFGVGGLDVIAGRLSLGQLFVLLNLLNALTWPLSGVAQSLANIKAASEAAERVLEVLELPVEPLPPKVCLHPPAALEYAVEFDRVSFGFTGATDVLRELSLKVRTGEALAIVGESGAGKSTLLELLLGFRQPIAGVVSCFGQALDAESIACVRRHMAYVPQDDFFLPTSVAENIRLGNLGATPTDIRAAAAQAGADEFIKALPQGYDTIIGEGGSTLSGGQRQRIALARAILRGAAVLLLDEATAALDMETERLVTDSILRLPSTKIIVTHRLHLLSRVDRIAVMHRGRVVEAGPHAELLARQGHYASLFEHGKVLCQSDVAEVCA